MYFYVYEWLAYMFVCAQCVCLELELPWNCPVGAGSRTLGSARTVTSKPPPYPTHWCCYCF